MRCETAWFYEIISTAAIWNTCATERGTDVTLPDDDRMIETRRSIFESFNINDLSVCVGWCTDQVTMNLMFVWPCITDTII
jgi:hypothetical protein